MPTLDLLEVVGGPRPWESKQGGRFDSYKVKGKDEQGIEKLYEISVKAGNPPPKLGPDEFAITPTKEGTSFPPKIKRQFSGGGGGGRGRSPEETKAIQRQHSQEMALRYISLLPANAAVRNPAHLADTVKHWTDWFERDITSSQGSAPTAASAGKPSSPPASVNVPPNGSPKGGDQAASPSRKGQTSRRFKAAGIDPDTQRRVVHAIAGGTPTASALDAIDAAIANNDWNLLFDEQDIPRPEHLPDTRDLAPVFDDAGTIL